MSNKRLGNPMDMESLPEKPSVEYPENPNHAKGVDEGAKPSPKEKLVLKENSVPKEMRRRKGDTGLGLPESELEVTRSLSKSETAEYEQQLEKELQEIAEATLRDLESENEWSLPAPIRRLGFVVLLVVASVLGLFLVSETVSFWVSVESLPQTGRWLAIGGFLIFGSVIAAVITGLLWSCVRLQRSPQIKLQAIRRLNERRQMQKFVKSKHDEARKTLETYLKSFPVGPDGRRALLAAGVMDSECKDLEKASDHLLDNERLLSSADWCSDFENIFLSILDSAANRRIIKYANRAGLSTAATPVAIVDRMIILYSSLAMIKDLLTIYQLRPAAAQTWVVFSKSILLTYLSGLVEESTEHAADEMMGNIEEWTEGGIGALTGALGQAVSAKAAEGLLNRIFLKRIGKSTIRIIRPVAMSN